MSDPVKARRGMILGGDIPVEPPAQPPAGPNHAGAQIAYDGEALRNGSMDVRDLAPALLAFGDMLQHANQLLNGDKASLSVRVRADFKRGSFQVDFDLLQSLAAQAYIFLTLDGIKGAKQLAEYIGLITGTDVSLLSLLKWLKGRKPQSTTTLSTGNPELTLNVSGNNNRIEVRPEVFALANDLNVRQAAAAVMRPLQTNGIERFEVRENSKVVQSIERSDLQSFEIPAGAEEELHGIDAERIAAFEVIKPSFQESLTWVFSDGSGGRINALMKDKVFAAKVERGERAFARGDILRVRLRSRSYVTAEGLRTDYEVIDVLEEITQPRQHALLPTPQFERRNLLGDTPPNDERPRNARKKVAGRKKKKSN